jgi:hypothetical protein
MKKLIVLIALVGLALGSPLTSQQQADTELPNYTPEQRWERASSQLTWSIVAAIAYAKSMGQSAEQLGEYYAKLFLPTWGEPGSGTLNVIRGVHLNFLQWTKSEFEITESSDVSVTGRSNRPWARYFGEEKSAYGVTPEDFDTTFMAFHNLLAEHLGLEFKCEIKDGWLYMTFSLKK